MGQRRSHPATNTCGCFGKLAVRIGLITREQLSACAVTTLPVEESLIRSGYLTPALAARVRESLLAAGCRHHRGAA